MVEGFNSKVEKVQVQILFLMLAKTASLAATGGPLS